MSKLHMTDGAAFLPDSMLEDVTAIVGRRGRGKTNTGVVMIEEAHRLGMRFCVVDPVGVWHGLRSSSDGKAPGIPVVVMGGEHAMVPLEPTSGKIVADFLAQPGPSVVLDFRLMRKGEMTRFMADFLERLYLKNREPLLVAIDEADKFAPQRPFGDEARMLGAAEDVVKMGRARGLHSILITQRPATLNKNVITQAGVLIAHGLPAPQDQKAIDAWIRERADEQHRAEFLSTLGGLERGEAWIWAPELDVFRRAQIRARHTFDSSATPKRGERRAAPKVLAEVDLAKLTAEIQATVERAKAADPKELQKRIADLERQLKAKPAAAPPVQASKPVITDQQLLRIEQALDRLSKIDERFSARAHDVLVGRREVLEQIAAVRGAASDLAQWKASGARGVGSARALTARAPGRTVVEGVGRPAASSRPAPVVSSQPSGDLDAGEQRILDTVLMLQVRGIERSREAVARWMGIHPNGGRYNRALAALRARHYLSGMELTGQSASLARDLPTGLQALLDALPDDGHRRVMSAIVEADGPLSREQLAEKLGIHPNGGRFNRTLAWLRTMGVIPERGEIRAMEGALR